MIKRRVLGFGLTSIVCLGMLCPHALARQLTLEDRVKAQAAIERVYRRHRTWPSENRNPRPALEGVLAPAALRARVEDALRKSNALRRIWGRPITSGQLQSEIERMAAESRAPGTLREILAALDNDPVLIAEALARPVLADRLIRAAYAWDGRIREGSEGRATFDAWWAGRRGSIPAEAETMDSAFTAVVVSDAGTCTPDTWSALPDAPWVAASGAPSPRSSPTAIWTGSELIVWGGYGQTVTTDQSLADGGRYDPSTDTWRPISTTGAPPGAEGKMVWTGKEVLFWSPAGSGRYDPATDTWSPLTAEGAPSTRGGYSAVWTGGEMIVWGGRVISGYQDTFLNDGARYDPSLDRWRPVTTTGAPGGRSGHSAVWSGREMIVFGGARFSSVQNHGDLYTNSGGLYDPATDTWRSMPLGPFLGAGQSTVWTGSEMIVWGGVDTHGQIRIANFGGRYSPSTNTWTSVGSWDHSTSEGRGYQKAVWTGDEMILWGGFCGSGGCRDGGAAYRPTTDTWRIVARPGPLVGFSGDVAVWTGKEMLFWGGGSSHGGLYDPASDTWRSTVSGMSPRSRHTAVWTGSEMIVWGGDNGLPLNDGARYDPATNSWAPTTMTGAPEGRAGHSAVWTGREMIVWGGTGASNTGGRYDPAADRWVPTSTADAPEPRFSHSAVWTGREMIVWGGASTTQSSTMLGDGGRYDPALDRWAALTHAGEPAGRADHTAVWTGSEMIVWGGSGPTPSYFGTDRNDGGRYDPSTDVWTPIISTPTSPRARSVHTAVWTGSEMIVWGGFQSYLDPGERYDPAADTWTKVALPNWNSDGPEFNQYDHSAVWTGREMIVWGGLPYIRSQGGRYDPALDAWTATTTTGAPTERLGHTAVWTGSEMIVWGGYGRENGARYCVLACAAPATWYRDDDGDGFGVAADSQTACDQPAGYVDVAGDCDDADAATHPEAAETCNGRDDDCDGRVDNAVPVALCRATPDVLSGSSGHPVFGIALEMHDACTGQAVDPARTGPLYLASVECPGAEEVTPPTPDSGPSCTQDGIWETVAERRRLGGGAIAIRFQTPSDGKCATLDGDARNILVLLAGVRNGAEARLAFKAAYPGVPAPIQCAVSVHVTGAGPAGKRAP